MLRFLTSFDASIILWMTVLAILVVVGVYLIRRTPMDEDPRHPLASKLISNFEELHAKGELSDSEYRTIKAMLAERLHDELKDTGQKG